MCVLLYWVISLLMCTHCVHAFVCKGRGRSDRDGLNKEIRCERKGKTPRREREREEGIEGEVEGV